LGLTYVDPRWVKIGRIHLPPREGQDGDAAVCQITLNTYFFFLRLVKRSL